MAERKKYVTLWLSYIDCFKVYTPAEVGNLVLAMLNYQETGEVPEFDGNERFLWPALKADIDSDNAC